jgi:two-component system sensor histidine kinase AlgZ
VLGIVRAQPKRAEVALEDMSDLFRMAMADAHDLVPLRREIELGRSYLALEQLRLGERLSVDWQIRDAPDDAMIPPLLLQPLLENAVYHGIEPLPQGGLITIALRRSGDELRLVVENPCPPHRAAPHEGNRMALQNIRERLALLFDVEARYKVESGAGFYRVEIALPYLREWTK